MSVTSQISGGSAREVAASIESAVRSGALARGAALPSVRELSGALALSPVTIVAALRELRQRGIVLTRERRGTIVNPRPPLPQALAPAPLPRGTRDLANGLPDPRLLPHGPGVFPRVALPTESYPDEATLPELVVQGRRQFAEAGVRADDLCVTSGALDGVERALEAHLAPGDGVLVEDPGYPATFDLLRAMGLVPIPVAIDDRGVQPKALGRALGGGAREIILTPRGQNPTGAAFDPDRAKAIREILRRTPDLLVVEDDHQGPLSGVEGQTVTVGRRTWAVVRSVAKSLGPDLRLAFVAGDTETVSRVAGRFALGPGWVSYIIERAVLELLKSATVRAQLARATRTYAERREALLAALAEQKIAASGRSGFNVWIPVADEGVVTAALLQAGWAVSPGARFRITTPPAVRVTTAALLPEESRRFARDLARVLRASPRPRRA